jgi:hypothetical protein
MEATLGSPRGESMEAALSCGPSCTPRRQTIMYAYLPPGQEIVSESAKRERAEQFLPHVWPCRDVQQTIDCLFPMPIHPAERDVNHPVRRDGTLLV